MIIMRSLGVFLLITLVVSVFAKRDTDLVEDGDSSIAQCPEGHRPCGQICCPPRNFCCYSTTCCGINYILGIPLVKTVPKGIYSVSHG
uniref:Cysteine rich secreted protein n=1 Tax=Riptortus pedestris TaxID=329032 RepID=R4WCP0_RIPPE|nr:cysteine rich secreted protein [Riptortus pedestris]